MAYTTIKKPSDYFDTKVYTGNGSSQTLTMDNLGMLWMKNRTETSNHCLFDSVRGGHYTSAPGPILRPNGTTAAGGSDITSAYGITFGSSSSTIGSDGGGYNYNQNSKSYVGWQWRANGTGSANTDGSINSTVSANTTSGFSIVSYTGTGANATVGHGLGAVPKFIMTKNLTSGSYGWYCYHASLGATKSLYLHTSDSEVTSSDRWNNTTPTSSVFSLGTNAGTNGSTNMIAYCFADVTGYSKFGSYVGNGNADGTFVYLGFKPAWVMVKNANNSSADWTMFDVKRNTYNIMDKRLRANLNNAEDAPLGFIDFTSNGFKWRTDSFAVNGSGNTHVFMAFAEQPLVGDNPATAR